MRALTFFLVIAILSLSSCAINPHNCNGSVEVHDTAVGLTTTTPIVKSNGKQYRHIITFTISTNYIDITNASNNCRYKQGRMYLENNRIIDSTIIFTCNKDLTWYNRSTIPAGTNLIQSGNKIARLDPGTELRIEHDSLATGVYTFYVSCTNMWGAHLSDSVDVTYQ